VARLLLLLALALPAAASTFTLQHDGVPVNGEICRFRAGDATNPFRRWFASQDVACVASGTPIEFPRGMWNVFGRTSDGISSTPLLINGEAGAVSLSIERAATVVALLPEGRKGVIYAPRRGTAFPVEERVLVPANEGLWLLVIEKAKPVALFPIAPIEPGMERRVDARSGGPSAVLGWIQVPDADRAAIANASGILAPGVRVGRANPIHCRRRGCCMARSCVCVMCPRETPSCASKGADGFVIGAL